MIHKTLSGIIIFALASIGAVFVLSLIGTLIEGVTDYSVERERCLKRATNGYEISRCR